MKRPKLIQICLLFLLCIGFAGWTTHASSQGGKDATAVTKEMEKTMPLLKGEQWLKIDSNAKVAFIWGAAHVILIEKVLMEEIPELKRENFSAKVVEARTAKVQAGTTMTINVFNHGQHTCVCQVYVTSRSLACTLNQCPGHHSEFLINQLFSRQSF